jgi:hypothetical protein
MISQIAQMNEADAILASNNLNDFINNIDEHREKDFIVFDNLL